MLMFNAYHIFRPEHFAQISSLYQVVNEEQNCNEECILNETLSMKVPFEIAKYVVMGLLLLIYQIKNYFYIIK